VKEGPRESQRVWISRFGLRENLRWWLGGRQSHGRVSLSQSDGAICLKERPVSLRLELMVGGQTSVMKEDERVERDGCSDKGADLRGLRKLECVAVREMTVYSIRSLSSIVIGMESFAKLC
jgi:hypothetical protein